MSLPLTLQGATVLLTGVGHRGQVGEVVARAFFDQGAALCLVDRDPAVVEERRRELAAPAGRVYGFACDLTDPAAVSQLAADVEARAPDGLHALVHLAGGFHSAGSVADTSPEDWHRLFSINLTTAFVTTRAFLPLLRRARGAIVYFASAAALPGATASGIAAYAAAKGGVLTLMRAVAAEERESGVRANALAPTAIRTAANLQSMSSTQAYVERETVANWTLWLTSAASGPVTGQVVKLG